MREYKIAIIGAGQIGSRHLQALALINREISIEVVDPCDESLDTAKNRFTQISGTGLVKSVTYLKNIDSLSNQLDVVIVATSANVRRQMVIELLHKKNVSSIILEKVVFQSVQDFIDVEKILTEKGIKTWVNCSRRSWPFYQLLKEKFVNVGTTDYFVSGANSRLGLGCNGIHFLDLYAFLTGEANIELYTDRLDSEFPESKRAGFLEFTGTIYGKCSNGGSVTISAYPTGDAPIMITIQNDTLRCIIREDEKKVWISEHENNWQWQESEFEIPFQSHLTHLVVQDILAHNDCSLTTYHESWKLHNAFLTALTSHFSRCKKKEIKICPIT